MKKTKGLSACIFGTMLAFLIFYCVCPPLTYAAPPQDVKLAYDLNSQTLTVTITHTSPQQRRHYIESVEIKKNGIVVSTDAYTAQPDSVEFTYTYKVTAVKGDALEVTATCNVMGANKTATLNVGK